MSSGAELAFVAAAKGLQWDQGEGATEGLSARLDAWLDHLVAGCSVAPLQWKGLQDEHVSAAQAIAIHARLAADLQDWQARRSELESTRAVAEALDRQAVFLVFGKFNAGKSSLCNFIAERFAANGQPVQYFRIEEGRPVFTGEGFREGATETTTSLQGVCLGHKLVLLDTPGLHSVTQSNAQLTRRFTDSADGVLWLTSSTAPGQVQELDELARELHRAKPLLPVVTRSDCLEEDEVGEEIVKVLRNKTAENRGLQETDVRLRGREKLGLMGVDPDLLRRPVSVSVHAARRQDQTDEAMALAGFDGFWAAVSELVVPALAYKRHKHAEITLHHAQERVAHDLEQGLVPMLEALQADIEGRRAALEAARVLLFKRVWRAVVPELPDLLERHGSRGDGVALRAEVSRLLADAFAQGLATVLAGHALEHAGISLEVEIELDCGAPASHERLYAALEDAVHARLDHATAQASNICRAQLDALEASAQQFAGRIRGYCDDLMRIKAALRALNRSGCSAP